MHLKSITLKGFKSFPDRTKLDFGPGVSVIVGPNGSGKSNVTDAVLWAMGEQSPLAVRGQSMQDVIFGGGRGQASRQAAEVEIVIDNGDGGLPVGFSEIAIVRKLDRTGEGEYRLNGARCRLVDVIEMLSDTGLGKEGHSIVSQGRVEAVVTSKPKDRRLLIEEAAGLGKHRKRRRRAQLKLERTQENLDRALDVEREARSRLRPLKRQAEAAELHARLERQTSEARWSLAREAVRARRAELAEAERAATAAHEAQAAVEAELQTVAAAREAAEEALAAQRGPRGPVPARYRARGAADRVAMRLEGVRGVQATITRRAEVLGAEVDRLEAAVGMDAEGGDEGAGERIAALEAELERLEAERAASLEREVASLEEQRVAAGAAVRGRPTPSWPAGARRSPRPTRWPSVPAPPRRGRARGRGRAPRGGHGRRAARRRQPVPAHRRRAGLGLHAGRRPPGRPGLRVGRRRGARPAPGRHRGRHLRIRRRGAGQQRATGCVGHRGGRRAASDAPPGACSDRRPRTTARPRTRLAAARDAARRRLRGGRHRVAPADFTGTAVTKAGTVWFSGARELRQVPTGGEDRVLAERNHRDELIAATERAASGSATHWPPRRARPRR